MTLPPAALSDLGRISDAEIARRYDLHPQAVRRARVALEIPRAHRWPVWLHDVHARFGHAPDADLAVVAGVSAQRVAFVRWRWEAADDEVRSAFLAYAPWRSP